MKTQILFFVFLMMLSVTFSQNATVAYGEIKWLSIRLDSGENKIPLTSMDARNSCRAADDKVWDLREQIDYFRTHREVYGDYYKQTDSGWEKTGETPPTLYYYKLSELSTNWYQTNLTSKLSWFRISGWVSHIELVGGKRVLFVESWDVIKQRKVPSYCLYFHPKITQFKVGDILDCMVYWRVGNSATTSRNDVEYESVQYGNVDSSSELTFVQKTNTMMLPRPIDAVPSKVESDLTPETTPSKVERYTPQRPSNNREFSMTVWVYAHSVSPNTPENIVSAGYDEMFFNLRISANNTDYNNRDLVQVLLGTHNGQINVPILPIRNKWVQFSVTRLDTSVKLYINGILVGETVDTRRVFNHNRELTTGYHNHPSAKYPFRGNIKLLKTYSKCLSKSEIERIYVTELSSH